MGIQIPRFSEAGFSNLFVEDVRDGIRVNFDQVGGVDSNIFPVQIYSDATKGCMSHHQCIEEKKLDCIIIGC